MKKLWRKFLCFIGFHYMATLEEHIFGMIMTLVKRKCQFCPKHQYAIVGIFNEAPLSESKYEGLRQSMVKVAEVTKGTGAEHMTQVTTITPSNDPGSTL